MDKIYNLQNIQVLLNEIFTDEQLRCFCYDTSDFISVYDRLGPNTHKPEVIDRLLKHAADDSQIELLLSLARSHSPDSFERHQPYENVSPLRKSIPGQIPDLDSTKKIPTSLQSNSSEQPLFQRDLRILIVDDEDQKAEPLRSFLENSGFQANKEINPHNVRMQMQQENYDIILLDIVMPFYDNYDGIEVLVDIKTFFPNAKVIMITGLANRSQSARVMQLGASDFVERSPHLPPEVYVEKVEKVMKQPPLLNQAALRDELINHLWQRVQHGDDRLRGQSLEGLIKLIFESVDGFNGIGISTSAGEGIDFYFENRCSEPFWINQGELIQIRCHSWPNKQAELQDYHNFQRQLLLTRGRLGFLISYSGFSDQLKQSISTTATTVSPHIVLIDLSDLERLVQSKNRERLLEEFVGDVI